MTPAVSVDALGKRFKVGKHLDEQAWITIVGIVGDVRQMGLDAPVKAETYFPYSQMTDQPWFAPRDLVILQDPAIHARLSLKQRLLRLECRARPDALPILRPDDRLSRRAQHPEAGLPDGG